MIHAYYAAVHDSTGFPPFFPMFGRHPRLAIDTFLGIHQDTETTRSQEDYVDRLKQRLDAAYLVAFEESARNATRQNGYYDAKVRHFNLEVRDRVLVEKKGHKGKHKIEDIWVRCPYVVTGKPAPDIPVYDVVEENARNSKKRTLHRNMLLLFTGLPCPRAHKPTQKRREKEKVEEIVVPSKDSEYSAVASLQLMRRRVRMIHLNWYLMFLYAAKPLGKKVHCPLLEQRKQQQSRVYQGLLETEDLQIGIEAMLG